MLVLFSLFSGGEVGVRGAHRVRALLDAFPSHRFILSVQRQRTPHTTGKSVQCVCPIQARCFVIFLSGIPQYREPMEGVPEHFLFVVRCGSVDDAATPYFNQILIGFM